MKVIFLIVILSSFLFGCKSVEDQSKDDLILLLHFMDKYTTKLEKYIEKDKNLSIRDKNTFKVELSDFKERRSKFNK